MLNVLSKQDQRHLIILETLYQKKMSSLKELSSITGATRKTIQEDFSKINSFISPMEIATSNEGCALIAPDNTSLDFIYSCILSNSLEFSILEMIFFEQHSRLEDYADALFISISTLKRAIIRINKQLERYDFKIVTGPIQIIGHEATITNTFGNFFTEKYINFDYPFSETQLGLLDKIISQILKSKKKFLNIADLDILRLTFLVSLIRIQNGHDTKNYSNITLEQFDLTLFDDLFIKTSFKSVFKIEPTRNNLIRLFYPFVSGNFVFSYDEMIELTKKDPQRLTNLEKIQNYIQFIKETFHIPLQDQNSLELELFNLISITYGETFVIYNQKKSFIQNINKTSPLVTNIIEKTFSQFFNKDEGYTNGHVEQFLYMLIVHWPELALEISTAKSVYNAGIFMTSDIEHSEFISSLLNRYFLGYFTFKTILVNTLDEAYKEFDSYDLIITNISQLEAKNRPIIAIPLYPSQEDFHKISLKYGDLNSIIEAK